MVDFPVGRRYVKIAYDNKLMLRITFFNILKNSLKFISLDGSRPRWWHVHIYGNKLELAKRKLDHLDFNSGLDNDINLCEFDGVVYQR